MAWIPQSPWKVIAGSGQSLAVSSGSSSKFTNAVGSQTRAIALSAITANCLVHISPGGAAATATSDILVKSTDPPLIVGCSASDQVTAYGLSACTLYLWELTH